MGMVVRSNLMAVNAQRQLGMNTSQVSKALEKLSSGYRINRAGDDASGLAISEKMKAQIRGLDAASLNSQDGISVVQTAEGALTEVHNMLNRMTELATRSANGINNEQNRQSLQDEVKELQAEIDRISQATNFNGINLLDGTMGGGGAAKAPEVTGQTAKFDAPTQVDAVKAEATTGDITANHGDFKFEAGGVTVSQADIPGFTPGGSPEENAKKIAEALNGHKDFSEKFVATAEGKKIKFVAKSEFDAEIKFGTAATGGGATAADLNGTDGKAASTNMKVNANLTAGESFTVNGKTYKMAANKNDDNREFTTFDELKEQLAKDGIIVSATDGLNANSVFTFTTAPKDNAGGGLTLQIGDTAADFNQLTVSIEDMSTKGIGIDKVDISSLEGAQGAIDVIREAIDKVSAQRATLGATQNRLEYTINNLDTASENIQAANSRIRDTDMAKMMMEYTKTNVITQSAQAMLAQANQQPQSILQLLQ